VRRIREILQRSQYEPALAAASALREEVPQNRDVLYMMAVAQRYLERIPDALATLAELEKYHPDYPRLYQERGHCHVALRAPVPATEAFLRAVTLNPSLPASWRALQALYKMSGQTAYAEDAAAHLEILQALPPEILTAFSMFADGEVHDAEAVVRQYLLTHGNHVEGMRLLAQIGVRQDVLDDAEFLLENVLRLAPRHHVARYDYAVVLLQRHKHIQAREQLDILLKIEPENRAYRATLATVSAGLGDYATAIPLYQNLLRETPRDPELHLSVAHALKTVGRTQEAIDAYRAAIAVNPSFGEAYWSLANLKTFRFTDAEIKRMRGAEASPAVSLKDRYHLCFALGKALEDRAEYRESFVYYERGNSLKKPECRYRPEITDRNTALQKEICTREFFAERAGFGARAASAAREPSRVRESSGARVRESSGGGESAVPIFIVGLPRSGSTLLEQILASHSRVEGTMELADIPRMVQDLQGRETIVGAPRYPGVLSQLSAEDCRRLGEKYLADTRVYRSGKPFFIDKMPNNFRHLGLIRLILPDAKIIDARREPVACCFSNFKQLFASGQQFTYSFEDLARYYTKYVELMAHWEEVLPGWTLRVQHEDVVDDLESNVRRILDFCGLDFEPACIEFHKTQRTVHTASSEQVRRPINREGLDQWRHYAPWLGPLINALGLAREPGSRSD
jgi:tetratricopeptide (TPR) repeat protein